MASLLKYCFGCCSRVSAERYAKTQAELMQAREAIAKLETEVETARQQAEAANRFATNLLQDKAGVQPPPVPGPSLMLLDVSLMPWGEAGTEPNTPREAATPRENTLSPEPEIDTDADSELLALMNVIKEARQLAGDCLQRVDDDDSKANHVLVRAQDVLASGSPTAVSLRFRSVSPLEVSDAAGDTN